MQQVKYRTSRCIFSQSNIGVTTNTCTSLFIEGLFTISVSTLAALSGNTNKSRQAKNKFLLFIFNLCFLEFVFSIFLFQSRRVEFRNRLFESFPAMVADIFPMIASGRDSSQHRNNGSADSPHTMLLLRTNLIRSEPQKGQNFCSSGII